MPTDSILSGKSSFPKGFVFGPEGLVKLVKLFGGKFACIGEHETFLTNMIGNSHFVTGRSGASTRIIIKQGRGLGDFYVFELV